MKYLFGLYSHFSTIVSYLQPPFLPAVRLYWGWQFVQTGRRKMHHIAKVTGFFTSLNIPFPAANGHFISGLELVGGLLLIVGLGSRFISLLLARNMMVAYWTAGREAPASIFSDPGKFYVADASLMILIFGAGLFSLDLLLVKRLQGRIP